MSQQNKTTKDGTDQHEPHPLKLSYPKPKHEVAVIVVTIIVMVLLIAFYMVSAYFINKAGAQGSGDCKFNITVLAAFIAGCFTVARASLNFRRDTNRQILDYLEKRIENGDLGREEYTRNWKMVERKIGIENLGINSVDTLLAFTALITVLLGIR